MSLSRGQPNTRVHTTLSRCRARQGPGDGDGTNAAFMPPRTIKIWILWTESKDYDQLKIITTTKISNKFSWESPYISNKFLRESPKVHTSFHVSKRSARHWKDLPGHRVDLEIQIFLGGVGCFWKESGFSVDSSLQRLFIEFVVVETKEFDDRNPNVILTRQPCGQRLSMAAGSKRWAQAFNFYVRVC